MRRAPHAKSDIEPPQGVTIVEVEAASGRVWRDGCGPSVVEVFLAGTEPRDVCAGYWDGQPMLTGFEEPSFMTEEELAEWARMMEGMQGLEPVIDPEAFDTIGYDVEIDASDSIGFDPEEPEIPEINPPVVDTLPQVRDSTRPPVVPPPPAPTPLPQPQPQPQPPAPIPPPAPPPVPIDSLPRG